MQCANRQEDIVCALSGAKQAISASSLASQLSVSRQIIVSDVALLRAKGVEILSTPKGYMLAAQKNSSDVVFKIACVHDQSQIKQEIYAIVDNGGTLLDVTVEHPVYGQLTGGLNISSRFDADAFVENVAVHKAVLLSNLTDGTHLHTISCKDKQTSVRIVLALNKLGILLAGQQL